MLLHQVLVFLKRLPLVFVDLAVLVGVGGVEVRQQTRLENRLGLIDESVLVLVEPREFGGVVIGRLRRRSRRSVGRRRLR